MPTFLFNYETPDGALFFAAQQCTGSGQAKDCVVPGDKPELDFWFSTGLIGDGSWSPGVDGHTGQYSAYHDITVRCGAAGMSGLAPLKKFAIVKRTVNGVQKVHFSFRADGTLPGLNDSAVDSDGDAVLNGQDCAPDDPSVRPPLSGEVWVNEICGDSVNSDCSSSEPVSCAL
jgi:hypothetical protein